MENWTKKYQYRLEIGALLLVILAFLSRWFSLFLIWPDSSIYLTAAMNLVRHGGLFIYANFPSASLLPQTELYSDYPPGYPIYLSVFYFFLRDPLRTALVAQSAALSAFALLSYRTAVALRFTFFWRIAAMFFFLFFVSFRTIFASLLNETLYLCFCLGVFLSCLQLGETPRRRSAWLTAYACLICSASIRWNGLANGIFFLFPIFWHTRGWKRLFLLAFTGAAALLPNAAWFARNSLYLSTATGSHSLTRMPVITAEKLAAPFENMALRWGFGHFSIFLLVLAFALTPFFWRRRKSELPPASLLAAGAGAQFLVIYALTLLVSVTALDDRYLSPAYMFFAFLLLFAANRCTASWNLWRFSLPALAAAVAVIAPLAVMKRDRPLQVLREGIPFPFELYLWRELSRRPYVAKASHYFTDDNYRHQIFIEKPQRLIFSNRLREPDIEKKIRASGTDYFFVLESGSEAQVWVENTFHLRKPAMARENIGKFVVYWNE